MANVIKLRKGLDINLKGKAKERKDVLGIKGEYALAPSSFIGVRPKVVVREGDNVKVGDPLFVNKDFEDVVFTSFEETDVRFFTLKFLLLKRRSIKNLR